MKNTDIKYKLIDPLTGKRLDKLVYVMSPSDVTILNYAYGLNGASKRMIPIE